MPSSTMYLHFEDRDGWRRWLEAHHETAHEVWLVFFKQHTGRVNLSYEEAIEEALCFGWVDSLIKSLDADRFARKLTPRMDVTKWSAANLARIEKLKAQGKLTSFGLAKVPAHVQPLPAVSARPLEVPPFFAEALAAHPGAREFFDGLAPSYRRDYLHWVVSAKREATRQRRLAEAVALLAAGKKLGMK